jgi:hypothetical protein
MVGPGTNRAVARPNRHPGEIIMAHMPATAPQRRLVLALPRMILAGMAALALALGLIMAAPAHAQQVRITQLGDFAFGPLATTADQTLSDSLCVYVGSLAGRYTVTAAGSGSSNSFALSSGGNTLPYEVQWAFSGGQTSGTPLTARTALAGTSFNFIDSSCTLFTTASLIVILRGSQTQAAVAGTYTGTLTLLVAPN